MGEEVNECIVDSQVPWERCRQVVVERRTNWHNYERGGPGVGLPAKTNNSPDLRRKMNRSMRVRGRGEKGSRGKAYERRVNGESRLALAEDKDMRRYSCACTMREMVSLGCKA